MVRKCEPKKKGRPLHQSYVLHLKRHLHLHLTHRGLCHPYMHKNIKNITMKQVAELAEASSSSDQQGFMREISMLQKSRSFKDPSTYSSSPNSAILIRSAPLGQMKKKLGKTPKLVQYSSSSFEISDLATKRRSENYCMEPESAVDEPNLSEREGSWLEINPEDGKKIKANQDEPASLDNSDSLVHRSEDLESNNSHLFNAIFKRLELGRQGLGHTVDHPPQRGVRITNGMQPNISKKHSLESERESGHGFKAGSGLSAGEAKSMGFAGCDRLSTGIESTTVKSKSKIKGSTRKARLRMSKRCSRTLGSVHSHAHTLRSTSNEEQINWPRSLSKIHRESTQKRRDELEISEISHNGCGLPWINWSKIDMKGKHINARERNVAGGNVSCGTSDLLHMRRRGKSIHTSSSSEDNSMPCTTSEFSDSSFNTDSDSFPLLEQCNIPSESTSFPNEEEELVTSSSRQTSSFLRGKYTSQSLISDKYMPKTFQDIAGQGLITQALSNSLLRGRLAKLYVFYGPRGVGKSSCARVFAMALNCISIDHKTRPCGACRQCLIAQKLGEMSTIMKLSASSIGSSKGIKQLFHEISKPVPLKYRVILATECHTLSTQSWDALMKVVESAPTNIIFILSTSSMERLPHSITLSGHQKFIFSKIKESEILNRLKMIAEHEGVEVELDALKLISASCDGSLRDAETMLDQLSLLGPKISLAMAQELMGLVPDGRLLDLLDFALSADTINTVRNLKELIMSGVGPLSLMSQLACLITSILAGGYKLPKGSCRRRFFRKKELGKEDMERLRQALKTLSEAEKQLRGTSDQTTWLTAALLQFAPDHSYLLPSPSWNTSFSPSSGGLNTANLTPGKDSVTRKDVDFSHCESQPGLGSAYNSMSDFNDNHPLLGNQHQAPQRKSMQARCRQFNHMAMWKTNVNNVFELDDVWQRTLDAVHSSNLRKFLQMCAKLSSLSLQKGLGLAVLEFRDLENISRAERSKASIAHAFEVTLGYPVDVKIRFASNIEGEIQRKSLSDDQTTMLCSSSIGVNSSTVNNPNGYSGVNGDIAGKYNNFHAERSSQLGLHCRKHHSHELYREHEGPSMSRNLSGTMETVSLGKIHGVAKLNSDEKLENAWVEGASKSSLLVRRGKGKVHNDLRMMSSTGRHHPISLGYAIQEIEDGTEDASDMPSQSCRNRAMMNVKCRAVIDDRMATQLEEENLRLESRSGRLQCWHRSHEKVSQAENTPRRSGLIWRLCSCGATKYS